jgi:hypothetical protein
MAALMGYKGKVVVDTTSSPVVLATTRVALVDSWSLNLGIENVDITSYGSSFRDRVQTLKNFSGSFTVTYDRSSTYQDWLLNFFTTDNVLANVNFRFYETSVAFWSGNGISESAPIQSNVADKVSYTYTMQGNGNLSYTTAT